MYESIKIENKDLSYFNKSSGIIIGSDNFNINNILNFITIPNDNLKITKRRENLLFGLILFLLFFFSVVYVKADDKFDYNFVYDVNQNVCQDIESYKYKFSNYDLANPKFAGEFPKRPGELVFINNNDEMYVFTDTMFRCISYQTYFIDEMRRQMVEEDSKYRDDDTFDK